MTLATAKGALEALSLRCTGRRTLPAPRAKLFRFRQGGEKCLEICDGLVTHLRFRVCRHQPIGLTERVFDLRLAEPAASEVRAPGAFTIHAMTVLTHLRLPEGLTHIGLSGLGRCSMKEELAVQYR